MTMIASYDWESDTFTHHAENAARQVWRQAVAEVADKAHAKLPECNGRIDSAVKLVLAGDVELLADGTARVASQSNGKTQYVVCNGECQCRDFKDGKAPHMFCKHRLGAAIARWAQDLLKAKLGGASTNGQVPAAPASVPGQVDVPTVPPTEAPEPAHAEAPGLPEVLKPYLVTLHGKQFVRYVGLLLLAHQRGLQSLRAHFISVTAELAMAEAEATFADGRVFSEAADATPTNVGLQVKAHYPRMALTRAKARTLRDALQIGLVALEELGDSE